MRAVVMAISVVWLTSPALAEDPAPAAPRPSERQRAAKAAGQLGSPKEDEPAKALAALCPTCEGTEADVALLRGLLYALDPAPEEIRVIAVEDLALLGDARAVNLLAQLVFDPNVNVQLAALRALAKFQTPRAEEILENVVRHPRIPDLMKTRALQALPYQGSLTAKEFLNDVATSARLSSAVRSAARLVLQEFQPPYAPAAPVPGTLPPP